LNAHEALDDLKQISVQVTAAAIGSSGGALEACTLTDGTAGERLVRLGSELWEAAEQARRDLGRDELSQVEIATPEGSVFVVRDAARTIVATTTVDPIVGLVFYDLRTCLRTVAEGARDIADPDPPQTSQNGPGEGFDGAA
jgi:predicted regulator of Ras-like GTPase activity (Roadblock/LC7/MglB family)